MITFVSIFLLVLVLGLVGVYLADDFEKNLTPLFMMILFFMLAVCLVLGGEIQEKRTSIDCLNGKQTYEKQYITDKDGIRIDSTYVKIK